MAELFTNSGDSNQTPHSAAFDLGLHCLPVTLLGVSRQQSDKRNNIRMSNRQPNKHPMLPQIHINVTTKHIITSQQCRYDILGRGMFAGLIDLHKHFTALTKQTNNQHLAILHDPHLITTLSKNTYCSIKPRSMKSGTREVHLLDLIGVYLCLKLSKYSQRL